MAAVTSWHVNWKYSSDLDEMLKWIQEASAEGWELKSLTVSTAPETEFDRKTGDRVNVWSSTWVGVMQRPASVETSEEVYSPSFPA